MCPISVVGSHRAVRKGQKKCLLLRVLKWPRTNRGITIKLYLNDKIMTMIFREAAAAADLQRYTLRTIKKTQQQRENGTIRLKSHEEGRMRPARRRYNLSINVHTEMSSISD